MPSIRENLRIAAHLTPFKVINLIRLRASFFVSRISGKNRHSGMPATLSIEPTTACNLGCPECPSGLKQFTRPTGNLSLEKNKQIIDELSPWLLYVNYYFQGEPFIHPHFFEMVKYASKKGIYTATSTNAHFLNPKNARKTVESGLKRLIISIDGTTQETYENYRIYGSLEKVLEGTKNIVAAKRELKSRSPHLIFQFLVVKQNEHQIEEAKQLAAELGVDEIRFKTAQVYDYEHGHPLLPENPDYSRYVKKADGTWKLKGVQGNHCWRMWSSAVMTVDGAIVPCCFDKDAKHEMGNISTNSFKAIWRSEPYTLFRKAILKNRQDIDICKNCSEGTKVWI